MNTFKGRFFWLVLLQLLLMASLIGMKQWTLRTGEHILLKAAPVDPRELFRGDYVALGYEITHLPRVLWEDEAYKKGDAISVLLEREGRFWVAQSVRKSPPETGTLFLQGRVVRVTMEPVHSDISSKGLAQNAIGKPDKTKQTFQEIEVEYGIESYFLPTKRAQELEQKPNTVFIADVVVDKSGRAVLRNLSVERGKPLQILKP